MTRIGCFGFTRSSSATEAADTAPREGERPSGQAEGQGGQRLQAGGPLSGLRRSVVSAFGGGHRSRVTLPTHTAQDKGKAVASSSSLPNAPKPRSAHEAGSHGHDGASTSASAQPHVTLGELMHRDRQTSLTKEYMAGIAPRKLTVQWAPGIPEIDRAEKVKGQVRGQHPPVNKHECTDPAQIAVNDQIGRSKRFERVYGVGSLPVEDDDATGEPADIPTLIALRTKQLKQDSSSEDSGSEFSVGGYSGYSDTEYSDTEG
jgi:hypothetical protein